MRLFPNIWTLSRGSRKPRVPHLGPRPVGRHQDFWAQSKMEMVGMCGNSYRRAREEGGTAHPVSAGHGDRDDSMTVIMIAVTIY